MANYTPQQIEELLQQFFDVVGTRQYIGARYVPLFGRKDEESIIWDNSAPYEPLTIVLYQGNSFTSRTYVPAGVDILDTHYWANTGNYNAQVEMYRQEVLDLRDDWQDYKTDLNGEWADYKEDTFNDLEDWKTETVDDFETAIADAPERITSLEYSTDVYLELFGAMRVFDVGSYQQSTIYVGERLFSGGQGISNNSVIVEISTTTGQEISHAIIPELGHVNGMCTKDGFIYVGNGNVLYQVNIDSLSIVGQSTYAVLSSINSCFVKDNFIYVIQNDKTVYKLVDDSTAEYQFTMPAYAGATQNSCYYDGKIYQVSTMPNRVIIVDFETHETVCVKELPHGDGIFPFNEAEGLFVKDNAIYVVAAPYINGGLNFPVSIPCSLSYIFKTNLISNFAFSSSGEKNISRNLTVNGSATPTFLPNISELYSYQIACDIASYLNYCTISIYNMNEQKESILLRNCDTLIVPYSGTRKCYSFQIVNSNVKVSALTLDSYIGLYYSNIKFYGCVLSGNLQSLSSDIYLENVALAPTIISGTYTRSSLKGILSSIGASDSGVINGPATQCDITIRSTATANMVYLLLFANGKNESASGTVTIIHNDVSVRFNITHTNLASFIANNDFTVNTGSSAFPKAKFEKATGRTYLSTEASPDSFTINVTNNSAICHIGVPTLYQV